MNPNSEYDALIKKIKNRRTVIIILTIVAVLITLVFCTPSTIEVMDKTVYYHEGINPIATMLIVIGIIILAIIAYAIVLAPMVNALDVECDPQKHLVLNSTLNNQKNKDGIYAVDFIYMGNFEAALNFCNKMIANKKNEIKIGGLFNKARCEFFLGDIEALKATAKQYQEILVSVAKPSDKKTQTYVKLQRVINLLIAISLQDKEKIAEFQNVELWNNYNSTKGFVNYLKGISAVILGNKNEAIYRLMLVKENCSKTVLAKLAEQRLVDFE